MRWYLLILGWSLLALGCGQGSSDESESGEDRSALSAPADYVQGTLAHRAEAQKRIGKINVERAIETFSFEEERLPNDLEELKTLDYLDRLPELPPRHRFNYDPETGEVTIEEIPRSEAND